MKDVLVYLRETIFRVIDALLFLSLQRNCGPYRSTALPTFRDSHDCSGQIAEAEAKFLW